MSDLSTEQRAEELARIAADRAAELALRDSERATKLAVARAVLDASVDRDLRDHASHLREINHSQEKMAESLAGVEKTLNDLAKTFETQTAVTTALAKFVKDQAVGRLSRRSLIIMGLASLAAYGSILLAVLR